MHIRITDLPSARWGREPGAWARPTPVRDHRRVRRITIVILVLAIAVAMAGTGTSTESVILALLGLAPWAADGITPFTGDGVA